jgi:hypothetical protein
MKVIYEYQWSLEYKGDTVLMNTIPILCVGSILVPPIKWIVTWDKLKELEELAKQEALKQIIWNPDYVFFPCKFNYTTMERGEAFGWVYTVAELIYWLEQYSFDEIQTKVYEYLSKTKDSDIRYIIMISNMEFLNKADKENLLKIN